MCIYIDSALFNKVEGVNAILIMFNLTFVGKPY